MHTQIHCTTTVHLPSPYSRLRPAGEIWRATHTQYTHTHTHSTQLVQPLSLKIPSARAVRHSPAWHGEPPPHGAPLCTKPVRGSNDHRADAEPHAFASTVTFVRSILVSVAAVTRQAVVPPATPKRRERSDEPYVHFCWVAAPSHVCSSGNQWQSVAISGNQW